MSELDATSSLLFIGSLGAGEIILILVLVLLLFGGRKIPQLAKDLGSGIKEFKDSLTQNKGAIADDSDEDGSQTNKGTRRSKSKKKV